MKATNVLYFLSRSCFTVAVIMLTACNSPVPKTADVKTEVVYHAIEYDNNKLQPSVLEAEKLDMFMESVPVDAVSYVGLQTVNSNQRAIERAKRLKLYLVKQGLTPKLIHLQPSVIEDGQVITLTIEYAKAVPPKPCPDWSKNSITNYNNTPGSNFGCAYYNNFIIQLDNPADFKNGHGNSRIDETRSSNVIQKYRGSSQ